MLKLLLNQWEPVCSFLRIITRILIGEVTNSSFLFEVKTFKWDLGIMQHNLDNGQVLR
jgi:hypothetical protein